MKVLRALGRTVKPFVNFPKWMGLKSLIKNAKDIKQLAFSVVSEPTSGKQETYHQAVKRLGLSPDELARRQREFYLLSLFFSGIGIVVLAYCGYHIWVGHTMAAIISLILSAVAFAMAFKNHFWYTQMIHERLGIHWLDWLRMLIGKIL